MPVCPMLEVQGLHWLKDLGALPWLLGRNLSQPSQGCDIGPPDA